MNTRPAALLSLLVCTAALLLSSAASAQSFRTNAAFSGGTLTSGLVLDATNTLCSSALSLSWSGDSDLGLQRSAANVMDFCVSGAAALKLGTSATFTLPVELPAGSAAAPSTRWTGALTTGFYWNGSAGDTAYSRAGTRTWIIGNAISSPTTGGANITTAAGGAAAPVFSATGDLDSGFARLAADDWGISAGGVAKMHTNATATEVSTDQVALATQAARVGGVVETNITPVGNVGAGTDDLMTYALAAGSLGVDMQSVSFRAWGTFGATANAKTLTAVFGATTIVSSGAIAANTGDWQINCTVIRTGAATQDVTCTMQTSDALLVSTVDFTTPGETLAGAVTIKLTGTATADDDIVQEGWWIRWDPQN